MLKEPLDISKLLEDRYIGQKRRNEIDTIVYSYNFGHDVGKNYFNSKKENNKNIRNRLQPNRNF